VNEIFNHAVKLLRVRDYSVARLRQKLESKFGEVPDEVVAQLHAKRFLNDRRFTENYTRKRKKVGATKLREELLGHGIEPVLIDEILSGMDWPSLQDALKAKMVDWNLRPPLHQRDAARLFRALARLGYEEDAVREEIEQLHEQ
jgi:SOS response regulatory protein OraA/RecX